MTSNVQPLLLTKRQVAELVGISTRMLDYLRAEGKAPRPIRPRGHPRWRRVDVERWVERMRTKD